MAGFKDNGKWWGKFHTEKNYWQQDIKPGEYLTMLAQSCLVTGVTAWLYYGSAWAAPALFPVGFWYYRHLQKECIQKKQREFERQFKEMIQTVATALSTGYSIENAIRESRKELKLLYEEEEMISREMTMLAGQLRMQVPVEQAIGEMAKRVALEEVENFAAVFITARRSGGDMIAIIKNTAGQIADKIDVRREIETVLAAKRYELKVMSAIPYFMIGYMSLSFPEFMTCLYGNVIGIGVMTVCLAVYISAYYLGAKLIEIEV